MMSSYRVVIMVEISYSKENNVKTNEMQVLQ